MFGSPLDTNSNAKSMGDAQQRQLLIRDIVETAMDACHGTRTPVVVWVYYLEDRFRSPQSNFIHDL